MTLSFFLRCQTTDFSLALDGRSLASTARLSNPSPARFVFFAAPDFRLDLAAGPGLRVTCRRGATGRLTPPCSNFARRQADAGGASWNLDASSSRRGRPLLWVMASSFYQSFQDLAVSRFELAFCQVVDPPDDNYASVVVCVHYVY